jgi:hypothetical protein
MTTTAEKPKEKAGASGPTEPAGATGPTTVITVADMTIHQRMLAILAELPAIGKDQRNPQQNFMYRGHDDVMNALNPLLAKYGVFIMPKADERITGERTTGKGSTMYEVNLHVTYRFYGTQGDFIEASAWGEGTDMGDKSTNKAMTMAFKNVLAQAFAISTAELSDADSGSPEETTRGLGQPARGPQEPAQRPQRGFNVERSLLPGAIAVRSAEDAAAIRHGLADADPDLPWDDIEEYVCQHVYGKKRADLTRPETAAYWHRLANALAKMHELVGSAEFPPPTTEQINEAFAFAFEGVKLALPERPSEPKQEGGESGDGDEPEPEGADAEAEADRGGDQAASDEG